MNGPLLTLGLSGVLILGQLVANRSDPAVPPRALALLRQHCVRCHDGSNVLDLRTAPLPRDIETWSKIRSMLEKGEMPPYDDSERRQQPMAPGERQELVSIAASLVSEVEDPPVPRKRIELGYRDWLYIVREVSEPFFSAQVLEELLIRRRDLAAEVKPLWVALDVCTAIVDVDRGRPPGERRLPGSDSTGFRLGDAAVDGLVQRLFSLVYRETPTERDVAAGRGRFRHFEDRSRSARDASIALCTSYLAGPRIFRIQLESESSTAARSVR